MHVRATVGGRIQIARRIDLAARSHGGSVDRHDADRDREGVAAPELRMMAGAARDVVARGERLREK